MLATNQIFAYLCAVIRKSHRENGLHLGITSELDSALGLHRSCHQNIINLKIKAI